MDLNSIVIGVSILALLTVAAMYMAGKERKESSRRLRQLTDLGTQHHLALSLYDFWNPGYAIGMDTEKKTLLYSKATAEKDEVLTVNLADVKHCSLLHDFSSQNGSRVINLIGLNFTFRNGKASQTLLFYSREENLYLTKELQLAEKWTAAVQSNLLAQAQKVVAN